MIILHKGQSTELQKGIHWWRKLSLEWKMAFNEAIFGKGATVEMPTDDELMILLVRANTLRFAGPGAYSPNLSQIPNNLSGVADLEHLTYLSFTDSKLNSLQGIKHLKNLTNLYVYNNDLTSLEGIEELTNLQELYCQGNKITSLLPVKNLTNLKTLYACDNRLTSLDGITEAHEENLQQFHVMPNKGLRHREIIKVQNRYGILCQKG